VVLGLFVFAILAGLLLWERRGDHA
jgi:hypothetical protein